MYFGSQLYKHLFLSKSYDIKNIIPIIEYVF